MKLIRTEDAAGQVLCHDITQIIPGEFKGARFRKGHIIQPEDIPVLLSIGKPPASAPVFPSFRRSRCICAAGGVLSAPSCLRPFRPPKQAR